MIDYKGKYLKYKTKYLSARNTLHGGGKSDIVILHSPNPKYSHDEIIKLYGRMVEDIQKLGNVKHFFFKFGTNETTFKMKHLTFENASSRINKFFNTNKIIDAVIICLEEASPFGLYFANEYPEKCNTIICYPLRLYTKESLERSVWKFKEQKGWEKYFMDGKYPIEDYLLDVNDERLTELFSKRENNAEKEILYQIYNHTLRKQYDKIPKIFKVKTHLFSRLDLDAVTTIEANFERKAIADIKGYMHQNDALYGAMIWNFARTKYDDELLKLNADTNLLRIHYFIGALKLRQFGKQADFDLLDCVKLVVGKC